VVFVRYALPGERVRVRVTADRGSYWHAEVIEVIEPSDDRIASLCPIAGVDGAGCCDLAFIDPAAGRALKAEVVSNQLARLGNYQWNDAVAPVSAAGPTGWRTRIRLDVGADGRAGFHRYHSDELVTDLNCGQLPAGMIDGLTDVAWPPGAHLHVVVDDDGQRHVARTVRHGRRNSTDVVEGSYQGVQRAGRHSWQVPVTAFWQAHRDAARMYSDLVGDWARPDPGMTAWDLYGGAGVFAAVLGDAVGESGQVVSVDSSRAATRSARVTLADLPQVNVITDSVRRALTAQRAGAAQMTGHVLANAHVCFRRRRQMKMRIKASDTVQAIQRHINFFGESFQLIGWQVAELALNFPELTENQGEEILTGGEYAFAPRKTTISLQRCCV